MKEKKDCSTISVYPERRLMREVAALKVVIEKSGRTLTAHPINTLLITKFTVPLSHVLCECGLPMTEHILIGVCRLSCSGFLVAESPSATVEVDYPIHNQKGVNGH